MMAWLAYALMTSLLAGVSAGAAERVLRAAGRPGRPAWVAAAVVAFGLPIAALAGWSGVSLGDSGADAVVRVASFEAAAGGVSPNLPFMIWAFLSVVAVGGLAGQLVWLRRRARGWRRARISGVPVLVSRGMGPAVLGFFRPAIVVPGWLFDLDVRSRRLAVLHEQEHCRAGDVALLTGMALLVALVPWNPGLWWQAARLHRAIELDCDERVLRRVRDRRGYGRMLLEAATRTARPPRLAAGLGRGRPLLERRIRMMLTDRVPSRPVVAAVLAPVLLALACALPTPFEAGIAADVGLVRSRFRLVEDSVRTIRATAAGRAPEDGGRAIYEFREAAPAGDPTEHGAAPPGSARRGPAGVIRRADPNDPRIRALEERRPGAGGSAGSSR